MSSVLPPGPTSRTPLRRRSAALLLLLAAALLAGALPSATPRASAATGVAALAFDPPSTATLRSSPRKAFAHYVPSMPVSLDNVDPANDYYARQYLTPGGEGGVHRAYGGYLRDRPAGRPVSSDSAWRLRDLQNEVRSAIAAGLDGFDVTVYQLPGDADSRQWDTIQLLYQAAYDVDPGFGIVLQPDMTSSLGQRDPGTLAYYLAQLLKRPSSFRIADGRVLFAPFYAEAHDAPWWNNFLYVMRNTHGIDLAFVPVFLDERPNRDAFAPISYAIGNWGNRNPAWNDPSLTYPTGPSGRIDAVHALGRRWQQPVSVQDERPREGIFDEAAATQNLRDTWQLALDNDVELVEYQTWNDHPEGSGMAPTAGHGSAFLDLSLYYLTWWKTGTRPAVSRDTVYLTHRKQPWAASPSYPQSTLMRLRGGTPARDAVEAVTLLTAPATVEVSVGGRVTTCSVPAGVGVCTAPLAAGAVSTRVVRSGAVTTAVSSPYSVTATPYVQDLQYVSVSSGRTGTRSTSTTTSTSTSTTVSVVAGEDSYANEGAPGTTFGDSSWLAVSGGPGAVSYLRFQVPAAPAGRSLVSSVLRLRTGSMGQSGSVDPALVREVGEGWDEATLTWGNRPAPGDPLGTLRSGTQPNTTYEVPVNLDVVRSWPGSARSLAVTTTSTDDLWFWSSQFSDAASRPTLVLTYR